MRLILSYNQHQPTFDNRPYCYSWRSLFSNRFSFITPAGFSNTWVGVYSGPWPEGCDPWVDGCAQDPGSGVGGVNKVSGVKISWLIGYCEATAARLLL